MEDDDQVIEWEHIGEARTPEGALMALKRRGEEYTLFADGKILMSSRMRGSEEILAEFGCPLARHMETPVVLVGGLGMGYTLRATLNLMPKEGTVVVAELMQAVVDWNRGPMAHLAQHPLDDRRVKLEVADVADVMAAKPARFDAILLDVDNGPQAFSQAANGSLYDNEGVTSAKRALKPGGILAVWSAWDDKKFEHRLRHLGFDTQVHHVRARLKKGGPRHTIFVGKLERT